MENSATEAEVVDRIKVVCRIRPSDLKGNFGLSIQKCVNISDDKKSIVVASKPSNKVFTFDYVAGEESTQEEIFEQVGQPVTQACLKGYNGTIFCYGQTGSGKTYTTFGPNTDTEMDLSDSYVLSQRGLVPRVLEYLFLQFGMQTEKDKTKFMCRCSFYEIFNERVFDLLDCRGGSNPMGLNIREDSSRGVYVEGLTEEIVGGANEAGFILNRGYRNRHVGETAMNRESSRSHAVFTLVIEATEEATEDGITRCRVARFNLVDLAGSERQKSTQACGERLKEASSINGSLSVLGQVINSLVEKGAGRDRHVAYRNSKLTFLLRDSLGGNSKTMLVAAISPAVVNCAETISTLQFAQRAKMIKNHAVLNEDSSGSLEALKAEVAYLRQQLSSPMKQERPDRGSHEFQGINASNLLPNDTIVSLEALSEALKRCSLAEAARDSANRRVNSLLELVEKAERNVAQKEMILKYRDSSIAAQRKRDTDAEKLNMAEEIAFLQRELDTGGGNGVQEVVKWRNAYKEAEAKLSALGVVDGNLGNGNTKNRPLIWTVEDNMKYTSAMEAQIVALVEQIQCFDERLKNEVEFAVEQAVERSKGIDITQQKHIEHALMEKEQEIRRVREEATAAINNITIKLERSESSKREVVLGAGRIAKDLEEERNRFKNIEASRIEQVAGLQCTIDTLTDEIKRASQRPSNSEKTTILELNSKLATALKENNILFKQATDAAHEADELEVDLIKAQEELKHIEENLQAEKGRAAAEEQRLHNMMSVLEQKLNEKSAEKVALEKELTEKNELLKEECRQVNEQAENILNEFELHQNASIAKISDLSSAFEEVRFLLDEKSANLTELDIEINGLRNENESLRLKEVSLRQQFEQVCCDLENCKAESEIRIAELVTELEQNKSTIGDISAIVSELEITKTELIEENSKSRSEAALSMEKLEQTSSAFACFKEEASFEVLKLSNLIGEKQSMLESQSASLLALTAERDQLIEESNGAMEEAVSAKQKLSDMLWEIGNLKEESALHISALSQSVEENECLLKEKTAAIDALELERNALLEEKGSMTKALEAAKYKLEEIQSEFEESKEELQVRINQMLDDLQEKSTLMAEYAESLAVVESERNALRKESESLKKEFDDMQSHWQSWAESSKNEIDKLSASLEENLTLVEKKSAAIVILENEKKEMKEEYNRVRNDMESATLLLENKSSEFEKHKEESEVRVTELFNALVENRSLLEEKSALISSLEFEMNQLREENLAVKKAAAMNEQKLEDQISRIKEEAGSLSTKVAGASRAITTLKAEIDSRNRELDKRKDDIRKLQAINEIQSSEIRKFEMSKDESTKQIASLSASLQTSISLLDDKKAEFDALKTEVESLKEEKIFGDKTLESSQQKIEELSYKIEAQVNSSRIQIENSNARISELNAELEIKTKELVLQNETVESLRKLLDGSEIEKSDLSKSIETLQGKLNDALNQVVEVEAESCLKIDNLEAEVSRLRSGRMTAAEKTKLEGKLDEATAKAAALGATVLALTEELEEEKRAREEATESALASEARSTELFSKLQEQEKKNAELVGHHNVRQRIQQHQKLKNQIIELQRTNKELIDENIHFKKAALGTSKHVLTEATASVINANAYSDDDANTGVPSKKNNKKRALCADWTNENSGV